jgi:hypothetical protein
MAYTTLSVAYINGDVFSAGDINNTNTVANALSNGTNQALITTKGDILTGSATANALVKTAVGSNNTVFYANSAASGGVAWGLITSAMITDGTITGTDIASGTITSSNILDATITGTDIASGTITATNIASGTITSTNIANDTITNADINSAAGIVDTKLATISTAGKVDNSATTATSANTGSAIVARDASGEFAATFASFAGRSIGGLDYAPAVTCGLAVTTTSTGVLRVGNYTSNSTCITTNSTTFGTIYHMAFHSSGTVVGGISSSGSTTSFNTSSDYRLKENVLPLVDALAQIEMLQPKQYNFISEPDKTQHGFIAHELADVIPYAVTGEKDALDDEGNIRPQQVDYSKLTGLLVGAVQELSARVKLLENN